MELSGYISIARRWWWTLLVATWIAGLTGYLVATQIPPTYEARVALLVGPYGADLGTLRSSGQLALTDAELVTVKPRLEQAIRVLGLDMSPSDLREATRVTANDTTRILTIRVQDRSPEIAAKLANTLAGLLDELVSQDTQRPEGDVQVLEFADPPNSPIAPQISVITVLTAVAGLLAALVLVVLIEYVSATVRAREDINRLVPVPFLGAIEGHRSSPLELGLIVERLPASRMASSYRIVATKIVFSEADRPVRSLLVLGAQSGDGSGETAANLAAALATSGRRTVLVDSDEIDSQATTLLGLEDRPGLAELVRGQATLDTAVVRLGTDLSVLPVGRTALDFLDEVAIQGLLDRLLADHDLVIVAGPPTLGSAEALIYARVTDASVVVVRRDQTKREALAHAVESLTLVGASVLGVVLDARSGGRFRRPAAPPDASVADTLPPAGPTYGDHRPIIRTSTSRPLPATIEHAIPIADPPTRQTRVGAETAARIDTTPPSLADVPPPTDSAKRPVRRTSRARD